MGEKAGGIFDRDPLERIAIAVEKLVKQQNVAAELKAINTKLDTLLELVHEMGGGVDLSKLQDATDALKQGTDAVAHRLPPTDPAPPQQEK